MNNKLISHRVLVAQLRGLIEKATPGEWLNADEFVYLAGINELIKYASGKIVRGDAILIVDHATHEQDCNDAALIAAAHNSLPSLLTRLERLEAVAGYINSASHRDGCPRVTHSMDAKCTCGLDNALNALEASK